MKNTKIVLSDGNGFTTSMNGTTKEIRTHFETKKFYILGSKSESMQSVISCEIFPYEEICNECGVNVSYGSGHYVNRVADLNELETRLEMGKPFPQGKWICSKCDNNAN
jgi:hypothetical protein